MQAVDNCNANLRPLDTLLVEMEPGPPGVYCKASNCCQSPDGCTQHGLNTIVQVTPLALQVQFFLFIYIYMCVIQLHDRIDVKAKIELLHGYNAMRWWRQ